MTKNHARKSAARARASMTGQPYTSAALGRDTELVVLRQYGNGGPGQLTLVVANWTAPGNRSLAGVAPGVVHQWPSSAQPAKPRVDPYRHMIEHGWTDGADPLIGVAEWGVVLATPDGVLNGIAWDDCLLYDEALQLTPTNHAALTCAHDGLVRVVVTKSAQPADRSTTQAWIQGLLSKPRLAVKALFQIHESPYLPQAFMEHVNSRLPAGVALVAPGSGFLPPWMAGPA
ncbi:hypothetical protein [Streptomyces sp. NPDC087297]|uniref:hypothetical protein n=1 Tax=Streptomyces sp. NPDC087297 TaxID=3365778 RepID=UPI00382B57F4